GFEGFVLNEQSLFWRQLSMRFLQRFSKPFLALSDVRRPGIVRTVRKPKRYVPALEALRDFDAVFCVLQGAPADGAIRICERSVLVFLILKKIGIKDRKSTRLNSSHVKISYAVFC